MTARLLLIVAIALGVSIAGGPFDHAVQAFGNFKKPVEQIDNWDRARAFLDHAKTDALIAENGQNLMLTQGLCILIANYKAKQVCYGKQFKMSLLWGNAMDIVDKGLTGGAIEAQIAQVPVIGEHLALLVPHLLDHELIHLIPGYPKPSYQMTPEQYYWFQVVELGLFWLELDGLSTPIKVEGNNIFAEVKF